MTVKIERGQKKSRRRRKKRHSIGFTNRLALYLMLFLATVVFTSMGTAISIVLNSIVHKSEHENTGADGEGIKFAAAKAIGFSQDQDSPSI